MVPGGLVGNRYEIEREAGAGGMGTVYRARDRQTGEAVAIKIQGAVGHAARDRFAREIRILAELSHPAIVRYVGHGVTDDDRPFLAMEWLDGHTLDERLRISALAIDEAQLLVRRLSSALSAAHERGILHRDIKPSNIFLEGGELGRGKLLDFGIARAVGAHSAITREGTTLGTPGYMSPEQARGDEALDARSDVFSLGAVLFECLAGRPAFVAVRPMALLAKILFEETPRLSSVRRDVPSSIDALVARMMAKDRALRPSNGAEVRSALDETQAPATTAPGGNGTAGVDRAPRVAPPRALTRAEQRLVSVIVVSAPTSGHEAQAALEADARDPVFVALVHQIVRFGGRLERLLNGSLVVALAVQGAAPDQAARAASCALAIKELLPRAAIVVATGRGVFDESLPLGEVIERAVALLRALSKASARSTLVLDDVTSALLPPRFVVVVTELGPELRGVERAGTSRGRSTPFVGRTDDLAHLLAAQRTSASEPTASMVLVTAPSGIGKSRLSEEFMSDLKDRASEVHLWVASGDPMRAGSPLAMLSDLLMHAVGIAPGDDVEARREHVQLAVRASVGADDQARVEAFIGQLLGVPMSDEAPLSGARHEPMLAGEQTRRAFIDFLSAESHRSPIAIVVDDLHWGDAGTIAFLDAAWRELAGAPIFLAAFARPEILDQFPRLWAGRRVTRLSLAELSQKSSERLVRAVLGDGVDARTVSHLVAQADGNPFFLEELMRASVDPTGGAAPTSVLAVVLARISAMEEEARRVLRAASIFGHAFTAQGVDALVGGDPPIAGEWIQELTLRDLLLEKRAGVEFRHAVVRDAAYSTLTDQDRELGHLLAAEWFERKGDPEPAVVAQHFELGKAPDRAIGWLHRAALHAQRANDFAGVRRLVERAISCGATGETKGALSVLEAEASYWAGDAAAAEEPAARALALLPAGSRLWYAALSAGVRASDRLGHEGRTMDLIARLKASEPSLDALAAFADATAVSAIPLVLSGRYAVADELLASIEDLAPALEAEPLASARIALAKAFRAGSRGDASGYLELMGLAANRFERGGDIRASCAATGNVGHAAAELGAYALSERTLTSALATASRFGLENTAAWVKHNLGIALAQLGQVEAGRRIEEDALAAARSQHDERLEVVTTIALANIAVRGMLPGAVACAESARRASAGSPPQEAWSLAILARALLENGRATEALDAALEAVAIFERLGGLDEGEASLRLVHGEALAAVGRDREARAVLETAATRLLERAAKLGDADLRRSFLENVPDHERTLAIARAPLEPAIAES